MPFPIDEKLVIAVASSALFDLAESDAVYRSQGAEAYRNHQREHEDQVLRPGVAFPFIRRLLSLNLDLDDQPVEVVLLSQNSPDAGLRVLNSIEHYKLGITRAAFTKGRNPFGYIPSFNGRLFLSADAKNVQEAIQAGYPAGQVFNTEFTDDPNDPELRIAFDFDGILASDEAEKIFKAHGLAAFEKHEYQRSNQPLEKGPLHNLLNRIVWLQEIEQRRRQADPGYLPKIRTAIITARNAPAHKRVVNSLRGWGLRVDEMFLLGGVEKHRIIQTFKPHIFFDDQPIHVEGSATIAPSVHVPFGVANGSSRQRES